MTSRSKSEQILDTAESMIRLGGFHAFSFRDIAREVGLKSASVHYHFPTKEDLGAAVMNRYGARSLEMLDELAAEHKKDWESCVRGFADQFSQALKKDGKLCLCGMLAAESAMLPTSVVVEVNNYVDNNIAWLEEVLINGSWSDDRTEARKGANLVFSTLEGAMMVSVLTGKEITLGEVKELMVTSLKSLEKTKPA